MLSTNTHQNVVQLRFSTEKKSCLQSVVEVWWCCDAGGGVGVVEVWWRRCGGGGVVVVWFDDQ